MKLEGGRRMAEAYDTHGSIYQNLIDAGCSRQTVEHCMALICEKNMLKKQK